MKTTRAEGGVSMMKSLLALLLLCIGLAIFAACEEEPTSVCIDCCEGDCPVPGFANLSERWHVLNNIEWAYTKRYLQRYDEVLDDDFVFFLSAGDVGGGLPDSWDRSTEVQANQNLFSTAQPPAPLKRCLGIRMNIQWENSKGEPDLAWIELTPPGSSETWYTTTANYDFNIDVEGDLTYINNPGATMEFTVRNAGTEDAPLWRLVQMRDLGSERRVAGSSAITEQKTWSGVKAMYRS
jgi:hypothetical protein